MLKNLLSQPLFLCGMMGSGKSTIGKALAQKLSVPYHDLDDIIEQESGLTIPEIFNQKGEDAFRQLEQELIIRISQTAEGIVSLGGGALQNQQVTDHVKLQGWLVFIECNVDTLYSRLKNSSDRPMIANLNEQELKQKIQSLLNQRLSYYKQAHFSIKNNLDSVDDTINELIQKLKFYEQKYRG
jgi:shikimate kinase